MDCASARMAMLEAESSELAGGTGSELGRHLASCSRCRSAAAELLDTQRGLAAWLSEARPKTNIETAMARAAAAARRRATVRRIGYAGSLLAAAAVAALLFLPSRRLPEGARIATAPREAGTFSVTAPLGREVVVMHTADPKIVVVWYMPSRRIS